MLRNWLEPHQIPIPKNYIESIGGNPLVSQVLFERGITDLDTARGFLSPNDYRPASGLDLPDLGKVVDILLESIDAKKKIGVWGDFDVDGQTATTLLVSALRQLGGDVLYHIPIRGEESHGIGTGALQKFLGRGAELILTCDTGISSHAAVELAKTHGVNVLITDHHDLPEVLPNARALVNPKFLPSDHPLSCLPGVGVAYKIIEHLFHQAGKGEGTDSYLDLVALGIVADVALLRGDTRYLLQRGLNALRSTTRLGLLSILELADLNLSNITEEHIGFILAPRLNAIGRLDDANQIVELLTTKDQGRARILAIELEGMNAQRKLLTDQVFRAAEAQISNEPGLLDHPVLVLSHPAWPAGVIGIVASRLVEKYNRPVILLSSPPGQAARGSARSIEAVNITSTIAANQHLVKSFGGHPMAAGLAMDPELIPDFRLAIGRSVESMGIHVQQEKALQVNGYLTLPELSLSLVEDLERLAPFGAGNPSMVLATRNLKLTGYTVVGRGDEHLQLTIEDELGHSQRSIWWHGAGFTLPESTFDLAYSVRASTYRGQREVQIEWVDYRIQEKTVSISISSAPAIDVVDLRLETGPLNKLVELQEHEQLIVWGEGEISAQVPCLDRYTLYPAGALAILTIPPGIGELQMVLKQVKPGKVYLFAIDPGMDVPGAFLKRLLGLMKYRLKTSNGFTSLASLAAATAQKVFTVNLALDWLHDQGHLQVIRVGKNEAQVKPGETNLTMDTRVISPGLSSALNETAAFRRYYRRAEQQRLVQFD